MIKYHPVLTIAGSDSSGGAGIQADIKTISAEGCYAMSAITAITAQNTLGVDGSWPLSAEAVVAQIRTVVADIPPLAVKTGMLHNASIVDAVADAIEAFSLPNIVVDPVMVSTSGSNLLDDDAVEVMKSRLLPQALLVTPNMSEACALTGEDNPVAQIAAFRAMGCRNILIKGGDAPSFFGMKIDLLALEGVDEPIELKADEVETRNTHGTGCSLSAAIAARLAVGDELEDAVSRAKLYVTRALRSGARVVTGHGHGPMNHFFEPKRMRTRRV